MRSMTGYGRHTVELEGRTLLIELKSVNHRFLDLNIKLPRAHNYAENLIRKGLQNSMTRGHIDAFVTYTDNREKKRDLTVDENLAGVYLNIARSLADKYELINDYTVSNMMKSSDVIIELPIEDDESVISNIYSECIKECSNKLNIMRDLEGKSIYTELVDRINTIRLSLGKVIDRSPIVFEEFKIKLRDRMQEALKDIAIDEARLLNEVAFYADRGAIDEEISRLTVHLDNFISLINIDEPNGRKLDFLVQEMNRETNTIGSKANDMVIVNEVLLMKSEIEKIREQIQNVE